LERLIENFNFDAGSVETILVVAVLLVFVCPFSEKVDHHVCFADVEQNLVGEFFGALHLHENTVATPEVLDQVLLQLQIEGDSEVLAPVLFSDLLVLRGDLEVVHHDLLVALRTVLVQPVCSLFATEIDRAIQRASLTRLMVHQSERINLNL